MHGDHERPVALDLLHEERDPEGHGGEGEEAEQEHGNDDAEVAVPPYGHGHDGVGVEQFPKHECDHEDHAERQEDEHVGRFPALRCVRPETENSRLISWLCCLGRQR